MASRSAARSMRRRCAMCLSNSANLRQGAGPGGNVRDTHPCAGSTDSATLDLCCSAARASDRIGPGSPPDDSEYSSNCVADPVRRVNRCSAIPEITCGARLNAGAVGCARAAQFSRHADYEARAQQIPLDDAQLKKYYDAHLSEFEVPEMATIDYVVLSPEALAA